jgi:NodT family efflux transporter outer membrane factor (OMF) lipoprotein
LRVALGSQRAAAADVDAARALIAASVARQYLGLARLDGYRRIAQRVVALREAQLALAGERFRAGLDPQTELHAAETALPEARQQAEALDEQIGWARHALAVLCGLAPQALDELAPRLPPLQAAQLPQRLGLDLLGRRADVLAARWRVEAAGAQVDEARAAFYPDINLVAFAGFSAIGVDRLLEGSNREYGIGPAIRLPLFDGGRLRAQQADREAELDAAVAAYRGVVLDATREALDALGSLQSLARQSDAQAAAVAGVERGLELVRQRRRGGLATELQLLAAEAPLLAQRRSALDLQARLLESRVALIHALGGGWQPGADTPSLPPLRPVAAAPTKDSP